MAKRGEGGPQYFSRVSGLGNPYPGPSARIMIEPVRGPIGHRLVDGVEDLRAHVATVEVDRFRAFPGRSWNLRIRNRHHTGMVIQGRRADHNDIRIRIRAPARSAPGVCDGPFEDQPCSECLFRPVRTARRRRMIAI